ncbi:hypothetical protein AQF52_0119 [Streptomyces venezuelae]|uniref:DUF6924 domain-containing protein n=1 Tax=Streptomyces gardneri TaxID=66892 RepID=UPI0006BC68D3|nr:hypothetical protein [Streptomyces gardneri]ALO05721.1 hypothetical protein AQF52_0119 [Streptomyces venezuelae]QPK50979.1 hypothetical protein H4W23_00590 [Streptomyces gardneri]WRK34515.1 hypothetical protein U0M97_00585 [Streptomyces venezuelae]CUM44094.1 hypothetical protein BN2537_17153 [Streptomyces venezuelae]
MASPQDLPEEPVGPPTTLSGKAASAGIRRFGREFRTTPAGLHDIHANLSIANMDFEEYAAAAHEDPEKVFRSF